MPNLTPKFLKPNEPSKPNFLGASVVYAALERVGSNTSCPERQLLSFELNLVGNTSPKLCSNAYTRVRVVDLLKCDAYQGGVQATQNFVSCVIIHLQTTQFMFIHTPRKTTKGPRIHFLSEHFCKPKRGRAISCVKLSHGNVTKNIAVKHNVDLSSVGSDSGQNVTRRLYEAGEVAAPKNSSLQHDSRRSFAVSALTSSRIFGRLQPESTDKRTTKCFHRSRANWTHNIRRGTKSWNKEV